ncbi:sulfate/molybdate ABC transporter ATP-binding protein [uncultured Demequina sp.]|uniref:sulfate/molybdate ABC transporter ATP-binding protein n=1 Tax=uncultured Demequina sp. TaxID=693499 RepID=UPI0025DDE5EA|nr:ATP-binding cassette domain-containing protein [uncultured Demequina sp.]
MTLDTRVVAAARGVEVRLAVRAGQTLAVLGPNGSGKSTVLATIAGVLRPDDGRTDLDGDTLHDHATRTWVPPRQRGIGLVTQGADLFPAMSVLDNVAFGIRASGARARDARTQALDWLERVGLAGAAHRRPAELSGGQARRATLARTLAARPRALLLDEPFAGVDVEAASRLRTLVADVTRDVTTVIATHDALDAHLLAQEVAVLEHGAIAESGPTRTVLAHPRTDFAARMAGRFVLRGTAGSGTVSLPDGTTIAADTAAVSAGTPAAVALAAGEVHLAHPGERELGHERALRGGREPASPDSTPPGGAPGGDTTVPDVVAWLEPRGDVVRVQGTRTAVDVTPETAATLSPGSPFRVRLSDVPRAYAI